MNYYNLYVEGTNDLFTYSDSEKIFSIGDVVIVSFRNKEKLAFIISKPRETNFSFKILNIKRKMENSFSYDETYMKLILWVKEYYMASFSSVFSILRGKKGKIKEIEQYVINLKINDDSLEYKELKKYFKKKEEIKSIFFEKKFSKKEIENLLEKKYVKIEKFTLEKESNYLKVNFLDELNEENTVLNVEQEKIFKSIENDTKKNYLIKGITGSGKTEVYIALMKSALLKGKSSIFLVPEISLTPQMINRFQKEFGNGVAILHSKMLEKERDREWTEISSGNKKIVLGARSAIFAPVKNLAYIIIDEEHETTYKQDNNLRYHAKYVALKRAELESAKVILGSATPSVESYYYAKKDVFKLLEMNNRYNGAELPVVEIIDMKKEENQYFSNKLLEKIQEALIKDEQVLLMLNRKGYSTYLQCKDCGHVEECSHCSIKYSYYQKEGKLRCNYCGIVKKYTGKCSKCNSNNLIHSGTGVEKIEEELKKIFPVEMIRVDSEASKEKDFHHNMYHDFMDKKYKIMIGTQMITKGLHFPNVTLVGVINGDTSLSFPDFRAGEKTFQLMTQVSGRAGRGEKKGNVIIQTYQEENKIFKDVITANYNDFYSKEIEERQLLNYPPFSRIINIGISSSNEVLLEQFAKNVYTNIREDSVEIYGPMPSLVYKVKDRYRYNILIKGSRENIIQYKKILKEKLSKYTNEKQIKIVVDVDPVTLI